MSKILTALAALDVGNDNHWTADGLPRLETVRLLAGDASLTREAVTAAAPGYSRANPTLPQATQAAPAPAQAAPQAPVAAPAVPTPPEAAAAAPAPAAHSLDAEQELDHDTQGDGAAAQAEPDQGEVALAAAQAALEQATRTKQAAEREVVAAQAAVDRLVEARANAAGPHAGQLTIQAYLQSQTARRLQRAAAVQRADTNPGAAAIDKAFARRTARGTQRPKAL